MRLFKKIEVCAFSILLGAFVLTGCGKDNSASTNSTTTSSVSESGSADNTSANSTSADSASSDVASSETASSDASSSADSASSESASNSENAPTSEEPSENSEEKNQRSLKDGELLSGTHHVNINVKGYGKIEVELDADTAPITVTNFMNLADEGFYNGLTFHRVISGFMIQGGDPLGNGTGGSDETIKGEFSENGVENDISHVRGVISMARSSDMDSASSQFFIMHQNADYLDGQYAAFGHVTKGMDVVDKIAENTPVQDDNGTVNPEDQPVIKVIRILD